MVNFTCVAEADFINFLVDNEPLSNVQGSGFMQLATKVISGNVRIGTLLVNAIQDNNNTNIKCRAFTNVSSTSNTAVLLIQGIISDQ